MEEDFEVADFEDPIKYAPLEEAPPGEEPFTEIAV